MSETNQKALAEMDDACRKLAEANILFAEMASKLLASHRSLREANATSVNRNAPCYLAIQEQLDLGYLKLVEAAEQVSEAFDHPLLIFWAWWLFNSYLKLTKTFGLFLLFVWQQSKQ